MHDREDHDIRLTILIKYNNNNKKLRLSVINYQIENII